MGENRKLIVVALGVALLVGIFVISRHRASDSSKTKTASPAPSSSVLVNKKFEFVGRDAKNKDRPITFTITTIEKKDEIKVKGESKKASSGNDFLLVRIELENDLTEKLAFTSTNLIRMSKDGKLFAPDFHNATVVLEPISVKKDLVAFTVPEKEKDFLFLVGELSGEKQRIEVTF